MVATLLSAHDAAAPGPELNLGKAVAPAPRAIVLSPTRTGAIEMVAILSESATRSSETLGGGSSAAVSGSTDRGALSCTSRGGL